MLVYTTRIVEIDMFGTYTLHNRETVHLYSSKLNTSFPYFRIVQPIFCFAVLTLLGMSWFCHPTLHWYFTYVQYLKNCWTGSASPFDGLTFAAQICRLRSALRAFIDGE